MQARPLQSPDVLRSRLFDSGQARPWAGVLAAVAAVVALLSGCAAKTAAVNPPGDTAAVSRIQVIAGGEGAAAYAFKLPERVPPGPTRISLTNNGDEPHHAQLFKLHRDATVDELAAALASGDPAAPLEHGSLEGGTALVSPGQTSRADAEAREVGDAIAAGTSPPATFVGACRPSSREPPSGSSSTSNPAPTPCCAGSRRPTGPRISPRG